jgi:hypothetical protein
MGEPGAPAEILLFGFEFRFVADFNYMDPADGPPARNENEVFEELSRVCTSPGYIHAIALICYRDNFVSYTGDLTPEDMAPMFSWDRLIRTELAAIIGLLVKKPIIWDRPAPETLQAYVDNTYDLMEQLHTAISRSSFSGFGKSADVQGSDAMNAGKFLREPILYSGESAYPFQYRELSVKRYQRDNGWLEASKGFSIETARAVVQTIQEIQNSRLTEALHGWSGLLLTERPLLEGFSFSAGEVAERSSMREAIVEKVLRAFALGHDELNQTFRAIDDFNAIYATPLIPVEDKFVLFAQHGLVEALYDSPFNWMWKDPTYRNQAVENRGRFTEEFCKERLEHVFGKGQVHLDVNVRESKSTTVGEIDVLLFWVTVRSCYKPSRND